MNITTTTSQPPIVEISKVYSRVNIRYIMPAICAVGIVTNLICCVIFLMPKFKLKIYKLLFWKSLFHLAALLIQVFTPVVSGSKVSNTFATTVYRWVIRTWVFNGFCMAALLCNLAVSFDRVIMISKKCDCFCSKIPEIVLVVVFLVLSLACFFFPFFAYYIVHPKNQPPGYYTLQYTDWGNSFSFFQVRIAMFGLRDVILWFFFVLVNVWLVYEARKMFQRKAALLTKAVTHPQKETTLAIEESNARKTSNQCSPETSHVKSHPKSLSDRAERRMTIMTIVMSIVLAVGQMPYFWNILLYGIFYNAGNPYRNGVTSFLNHLAFDMIYVSFAVSVFIYYFFDKNFKSVIDGIFVKDSHKNREKFV